LLDPYGCGEQPSRLPPWSTPATLTNGYSKNIVAIIFHQSPQAFNLPNTCWEQNQTIFFPFHSTQIFRVFPKEKDKKTVK
jgi:hypothetical protein